MADERMATGLLMRLLRGLIFAVALMALVCGCAGRRGDTAGSLPGVRSALLPPNQHGRLVNRTMRPRYITIHSTANVGATAADHSAYLRHKGKRSRRNRRFGRSGWVVWHFTVDDREAVQHLLSTEQGDHADYGGGGDRSSIGVEICEFGNTRRQAAATHRAARLAAALANRHGIPTRNIVPHKHWPRWDFRYGKPCPRILLDRDRSAPGGWREGSRWRAFIRDVQSHREGGSPLTDAQS